MKKLLAIIALGAMIIGSCAALGDSPNPTATASPDAIPWETAVDILNSGRVKAVFQLHNLEVTLVLLDGTLLKTVEPSNDAVFDEVDKFGQQCRQIMLATE